MAGWRGRFFSSLFFFLHTSTRTNVKRRCRIDRCIVKTNARGLHLAYPIHLYGLSLINSFLARPATLVPSLSHDKTSLTSSATSSASHDSHRSWNRNYLPSPLKLRNPLHDQRHASDDAPETLRTLLSFVRWSRLSFTVICKPFVTARFSYVQYKWYYPSPVVRKLLY